MAERSEANLAISQDWTQNISLDCSLIMLTLHDRPNNSRGPFQIPNLFNRDILWTQKSPVISTLFWHHIHHNNSTNTQVTLQSAQQNVKFIRIFLYVTQSHSTDRHIYILQYIFLKKDLVICIFFNLLYIFFKSQARQPRYSRLRVLSKEGLNLLLGCFSQNFRILSI